MPTNKNTERRMLAVSFILIGAVLILESIGFLAIIQILMSNFVLSSTAAWILWLYTFIKIVAGIFSTGVGFLLFVKKTNK